MRKYGLRALAGRKFKPCTTDSRHDLTIAPNLLEQEFGATAPNQIWLADITSTPTGEGWLGFGKCPRHFRRLRYLAAVRDMATRKIVGWSQRDFGRSHMRTELPLAALRMATQRQRPPGPKATPEGR